MFDKTALPSGQEGYGLFMPACQGVMDFGGYFGISPRPGHQKVGRLPFFQPLQDAQIDKALTSKRSQNHSFPIARPATEGRGPTRAPMNRSLTSLH